MGLTINSFKTMLDKTCMKMASKVMDDDCHPLNISFNFLRSGKGLCVLRYHTNKYGKSIVPHDIKLHNQINHAM